MEEFTLNVGDTVFVRQDLRNCPSARRVGIIGHMLKLEGSYQIIESRYHNKFGNQCYRLVNVPRLVWALDFFDLPIANPSIEFYEYR